MEASIGKAKFVGEENVAMLKCHSLGLGGYNVVAIDKSINML
jgi:hypothetical protein